MHQRPVDLILLLSKLPKVKVVPVAVALFTLLSKSSPRVVNGIANATNARIARRPLILSSHATVPTEMSTAKHATARSGDLTVMVLPADLDSCKRMVCLRMN